MLLLTTLALAGEPDGVVYGGIGVAAAGSPFSTLNQQMADANATQPDAATTYGSWSGVGGVSVGIGVTQKVFWTDMIWTGQRTSWQTLEYTMAGTDRTITEQRQLRPNTTTIALGLGVPLAPVFLGAGGGFHMEHHRMATKRIDTWAVDPEDTHFSPDFGGPWVFRLALEGRVVVPLTEYTTVSVLPYVSWPVMNTDAGTADRMVGAKVMILPGDLFE